jgi:hypothetical protein
VRISDDERHTRQRSNLVGSALRVASSHKDAGFWILAVDTTNRSSGILIG